MAVDNFSGDNLDEVEQITLPLWILKPLDEIGSEIVQRVDEFNNFVEARGYKDRWTKSANYYNGNYQQDIYDKSTGLSTNGDSIFMPTNELRSIVETVVGIPQQTAPNFQVIAQNTSSQAARMTGDCQDIIDFYKRSYRTRLTKKWSTALEHSYVLDAGFVLTEWDFNIPGPAGSQGDIVVSNPNIFDVTHPNMIESWEEADWVIVRQWKSRANMMTQFPELVEEIDNQINLDNLGHYWRTTNPLAENGNSSGSELNDAVLTFKFFHRRTAALPNGRWVWVLGDGTPLIEYELPYENLPIDRITLKEEIGTIMGRSPINDLVPLQELLNIIDSSCATNIAALRHNIVCVPDSSDFSPEEYRDGIILIRVPQGSQVPQIVSLAELSNSVLSYRNLVLQSMNALAGLSEVQRGGTQGGVTAGNALALMASLAAQTQGPWITAYNEFVGRQVTTLIKQVGQYGLDKRMYFILGPNKPLNTMFHNDYFSAFDSVVVQEGNSALSSVAGRMATAQQLAGQNLIDASQYMEVMRTGNLDFAMDDETEEYEYIISENESLLEGEQVTAMMLDNHQKHIKKHMAIINDVDLRKSNDPKDAQILQTAVAHIQMHQQFMNQMQQGMNVPGAPPQPAPGQMTQHPQAAPGGQPKPPGPPQGAQPGPQPPAQGQPNPQQARPLVGPGNPVLANAQQSNVRLPQAAKAPAIR